MNETITRAAGALHGQEWGVDSLTALIRDLGREPWQRTTLYEPVPTERAEAALQAPPLDPVHNTPAGKYERRREGELLRNQLITRSR